MFFLILVFIKSQLVQNKAYFHDMQKLNYFTDSEMLENPKQFCTTYSIYLIFMKNRHKV